jgi:hypothetical protein
MNYDDKYQLGTQSVYMKITLNQMVASAHYVNSYYLILLQNGHIQKFWFLEQ